MTKTSLRAALMSLALVAAAAPVPALAQKATPTAVLVVDVNRVFMESAAGQDANRQLKVQADQLQARLVQLREQFKTEEEALRKQQGQVAQEAFQAKVNDLLARQRKADEEIGAKRSELERLTQNAQRQIAGSVEPIVEQVRVERQAQLVVDRQAVLKIAPELDVTTVVIQRLNTKLPKLSLAAPAAAAAADKK